MAKPSLEPGRSDSMITGPHCHSLKVCPDPSDLSRIQNLGTQSWGWWTAWVSPVLLSWFLLSHFKSPSVLFSLPHRLFAILLYFSFSDLGDLRVWGHERLITPVWTRLTAGRLCENFSHTLVPAGLGPEVHTPFLCFLAVDLSGANQTHREQTAPWFWGKDPWDVAAWLTGEPALDVFTSLLKRVSDQRRAGTLPSWHFNLCN